MRFRTIIVTVTLLLLLAVVSFVSGCNMWSGLGKDVERGGEKMQGK